MQGIGLSGCMAAGMMAMLLAACGGGGSGSSDSQDAAATTGSSSGNASSTASGEGGTTTSSCDALADRIRTTTLTVSSVAEDDEYTPTVIAPESGGTSLLTWTDETDSLIRVARLGSDDTLQSYLPDIEGAQVHAALSDTNGAVLAVVSNDPDIYSSTYCYSSDTPDNYICGKMDLVGITSAGATRFRTTLTDKTNVDSDGAQFIWWYAHSARIATDGSQYGVYYRGAMSVDRGDGSGEIDIHAGDTLAFVSTDGTIQSGGWDWGCSHSWAVRLAYNGTWGAACHGDAYPNAMRLARLATSTSTEDDLEWLADTDATGRALGGLVPVSGDGFWMDYIETADSGDLELKLAKLPDSGSALGTDLTISSATDLDSTYPFRPYMAALGSDSLLLGWKSGGSLVLAVADASSGAITEGPVTTTVPVGTFEDFVSTADGDVVWAHSDGGTTISVTRVAACRLD